MDNLDARQERNEIMSMIDITICAGPNLISGNGQEKVRESEASHRDTNQIL